MIKKIAIQGEKASFHDIAAQKYFGPNIEIICCETFKDSFNIVESGDAEYALCAIENSLFGSINETYDLLVKFNFVIVGEVFLRISQSLIVLPGTKLQDIKEVYSHPVAIAQCEDFLDKHLPNAKRLEYYDTAASVEMIRNRKDKKNAAIASSSAAKLYDLKILKEGIETNKQNYTRFVVITKKPIFNEAANKTSLIIRTNNNPGSLYRALGVFAERSINISKLQSRPIIGKAWHYIFYLDIDKGLNDKELIDAFNDLKVQKCELKILGSYLSGNKT